MNRLGTAALAALAGSVCAGAGCTNLASGFLGRPSPEAGLLRGKMPIRSSGVTHVDRLTDGIVAEPDDPPRTDLTSVWKSPLSFATYDLGAEVAVDCLAIAAGGDDSYTVALSDDGRSFQPLWIAPPTGELGIEPRAARQLGGRGRYLRVTAAGGDGVYAVAELSAASACPPRWPPALALEAGTPLDASARIKAWAFGLCAAAFILGYRRRAPDFVKLLVAVPLGLGTALVVQLVEMWPPSPPVWAALVVALAMIVGATTLRLGWARLRPSRRG